MRIINPTNTESLRLHAGKECQLIHQLDAGAVDLECWPMFYVEIGGEHFDVFLDELDPPPTDWLQHPDSLDTSSSPHHASKEEEHGRYLDCGPGAWDDR